MIVETDAGGDPDDEQSMVRFLVYSNEWDVEGIICNRETARDGENRNRQRTGLGIVEHMIEAYGDHTTKLQPPFTLWVDTFRPELDRKRWYHRFSALTATAGGFDIKCDVMTGHGPLGARYPFGRLSSRLDGFSIRLVANKS